MRLVPVAGMCKSTWAGLRLRAEDAAEGGPERRDAQRRVPQHHVVHRVLVDLALAVAGPAESIFRTIPLRSPWSCCRRLAEAREPTTSSAPTTLHQADRCALPACGFRTLLERCFAQQRRMRRCEGPKTCNN